MGMFDTVIFKCLKCKHEIEEQSKAGECRLEVYPNRKVPIDIAIALDGADITCPNCKSIWRMQVESHPQTLYVFLTEPD